MKKSRNLNSASKTTSYSISVNQEQDKSIRNTGFWQRKGSTKISTPKYKPPTNVQSRTGRLIGKITCKTQKK
jgi:hypothetical protein